MVVFMVLPFSSWCPRPLVVPRVADEALQQRPQRRQLVVGEPGA